MSSSGRSAMSAASTRPSESSGTASSRTSRAFDQAEVETLVALRDACEAELLYVPQCVGCEVLAVGRRLEKPQESPRQFIVPDQSAVATVLGDLDRSGVARRDHWSARSHSLDVGNSESFVGTWEAEHPSAAIELLKISFGKTREDLHSWPLRCVLADEPEFGIRHLGANFLLEEVGEEPASLSLEVRADEQDARMRGLLARVRIVRDPRRLEFECAPRATRSAYCERPRLKCRRRVTQWSRKPRSRASPLCAARPRMWIASLSELPCTRPNVGRRARAPEKKVAAVGVEDVEAGPITCAQALRELERAQRTLHPDGLGAVARTG